MLASAIKESSSNLWLVVVALLFATVSVYYYFKVIQAMYFKEGEATTATIHPLFKYLLLLLVVLIIIIGVYPSALLQWFYF
jgi:NADH-quinone oxidoreductase subunit N